MLSAVDTNVISALWSKEPTAVQMSELLKRARERGGLVICAPVHAELRAYPGATLSFIERFLQDTDIQVDFVMSEEVWHRAGEAYAVYAERRRSSGSEQPKRLLVDFVVGAHALLKADLLLTLDPKRYQIDFSELRLSPPLEGQP